MRKSLPNVILIGAQKSGTTALFNWLSQHPDVFGDPAMKDFPFYCHDGYLDKGLEWFAKRFSGWNDEKIILHGYVHYLFYAQETANHFANMAPDTKLLAILRNPIDRAYSAYLQARKTGREVQASFAQAIDFELSEQLDGFDEITNRGYISHGRYSEQLKELLSKFPRERIKVVLFDDMSNDPIGTCREVFDFMEVDNNFAPKLVRKNDFGVPRTKLVRMINAPNPISWVAQRLVPLNTRIRLRHLLIRLNTRKQKKPELSVEQRQRLFSLYQQEIRDLEQLLNLNLDCWRPD